MFTQLLLADEVNRASPKAQSALLEAMEERQVSIEGVTYALPEPFFVVATQNPHEQIGTYGLPESQLDRFLMRVSLGYPDPASERRVLLQGERRELLQDTPRGAERRPKCWRCSARRARCTSPTRCSITCRRWWRARALQLALGLSPRAAQGLLRAAQAWALIEGENAVLPEHVQTVFPADRRASPGAARRRRAERGGEIADALIRAVPVPI